MGDYVIYTDSAGDVSTAQLKEWGVENISMTFRFDGGDAEYEIDDMPVKEFYDRMRQGGVARTAAIGPAKFIEVFEPVLAAGHDILYLCFDSALSTTYHNAQLAAEELLEKYPDRKLLLPDCLCPSAGLGFLTYLVVQKKNAGATIEECVDFIEETKLHVDHWFTVDDLVYLKRGGRISAAAAFVGGALGIKPIMHVDNEGRLINMFKVRGRKASLRAIADKYTELAIDPKAGPVFIGHADCMEDAQALAAMLKADHGVEVTLFTDIGPVVGTHMGPGGIDMFFLGTER